MAMGKKTQVLVACAALALTQLHMVSASLGDDLDEFQHCVMKCDIVTCQGLEKYSEEEAPRELAKRWIREQKKYHYFDEPPFSLDLRVIGWECLPNCDYQCQRAVTIDRYKKGEEIYQFHGKWPFIRVLGIQELFSTIFSIGNWFPHYWGFKKILAKIKSESSVNNTQFVNLYFAYLIISMVTMCAWFFSTVFHLRDTWNRERLDYFFAGATVISGLYGIGTRVFKLYLTENNFKRFLFGSLIVFLYICHVTRLLVDWSYTYNMQANVFIGLIQNVLWIYHSISSFSKLRQSHNKGPSEYKSRNLIDDLKDKEINWTLIPILLVGSVTLGMSFELFDFPPILELIDAHALWHLATIWPAIYWYDYMIKDVEEGLKVKKYD